MNRVCLVIPYFGQLPNYYNLWLESAKLNNDFDFLIITDCIDEKETSENVKIINTSFGALVNRIQSLYPFRIKLRNPYKLCDYRPAYGEIFEQKLKGYEFWGYCDIDIIFGDISKFITNDVLNKYDKVNLHGHFSLFRNNEKMNQLYKTKRKELIDYKTVFKTNWSYHFDEYPGISFICEYENIRTIDIEDYADLSWLDYKFIKKYDKSNRANDNDDIIQVFYWKDGLLTNLVKTNKEIEKSEYMYVHLQKRKMENNVSDLRKGYYIVPNEFIQTDEIDIKEKIEDYDNNDNDELLKEFKKQCWKNRFKISYWKMKIIMRNKRWK